MTSTGSPQTSSGPEGSARARECSASPPPWGSLEAARESQTVVPAALRGYPAGSAFLRRYRWAQPHQRVRVAPSAASRKQGERPQLSLAALQSSRANLGGQLTEPAGARPARHPRVGSRLLIR